MEWRREAMWGLPSSVEQFKTTKMETLLLLGKKTLMGETRLRTPNWL